MAVNQAVLEALARQKVAAKTPTGLVSIAKPKSVEDWFDLDLAAASESQYPTAYAWLPNINDPQSVRDYITGAYGANQIKLLEDKAVRLNAPNYTKILSSVPTINGEFDYSKGTLDQWIVSSLYGGTTPAEILNLLAQPEATAGTPKYKWKQAGKAIKIDTTALEPTINNYATEKTKADKAKETYLNSFVQDDKYFKAKIPNPKFVYGDKTDLANGIIDFRTHPTVVKELNNVVQPGSNNWTSLLALPKRQEFTGKNITSPYGGMPETKVNPTAVNTASNYTKKEQELIGSIVKDKNTPFEDEKARRVYLRRTNKK